MKKLFFLMMLAVMTMTATAQRKVTLSTYNGTPVSKYAGQQCDVSMSRYLVTGWNTISLPFAVSEQELEAIVGENYRLERLTGVSQQGNDIELLFSDCKAEGIKAGMPYILYYTGETGYKKFNVNAELVQSDARLSFVTQNGVEVTMGGANVKTDGRGKYGILVINNAEANFTTVEHDNVFYATRCYVETSGSDSYNLIARHMGANELTGISEIAADGNEPVDVFNLQGMRVAKSVRVADIYNMEPGIYVIKGRKVLVK